MVEKQNIISDDCEIAGIFNEYFGNIIGNLGIKYDDREPINSDPVMNAISLYEKHPSIIKIKRLKEASSPFKFSFSNIEEVEEEINKLNVSKAIQSDDIPTKVIKANVDIFAKYVTEAFDKTVTTSIFLHFLKNADIKPIWKKDSRSDKSNYRPVSILPNLSKIFEKILYKQMERFSDLILSKKQCGFRKGFNAENCLLVMPHSLPHSLLIPKIHVHGFDMPSLRLIHSYLTNRTQRVKINNSYSQWSTILYGVPILGPLLFNIFLSDLFLFIPKIDIANYADDNAPYTTGMDTVTVLQDLREASLILTNWLESNFMKANPDKYHLIVSNEEESKLEIGNSHIKYSKCEKLLGIKIDNKLSFEAHVESLCKKASQKLNALSRIALSISFEQRKITFNSFFISQFSYCPLIWMFHSRKLNNRINRLHERALRLVYMDNESTFEELLLKDNSLTIHQRNLQKLMIEIFKVKIGVAPDIMQNVFNIIETHYELRTDTKFMSRNIHTVKYGRETPSFIGPALWRILPMEYKMCSTLEDFKANIKKWIPENCPCNLCKTYVHQVGYL